jgi:hypothetical protein
MSLFVFAALLPIVGAAAPPAVGERAPDFTLSTPEGKHIRLSDVTSMGPVVLVVLRGYPGYQCPYCNRQVQDFMQNSKAFADAGARVVMIYPGPPQELGAKQKSSWLTRSCRIISTSYWIPDTNSPPSTGCDGTLRMRLPTLRRS